MWGLEIVEVLGRFGWFLRARVWGGRGVDGMLSGDGGVGRAGERLEVMQICCFVE